MNLNTISLVGRLTRDPEPDRTAAGTAVCRLRLAVARRWRDGQDQGAMFVTVVTYGAQASTATDHLAKCRLVAVSGRLEHREWTGADDARHSVHEVIADHVEFLDRPDTADETAYGSDSASDARP